MLSLDAFNTFNVRKAQHGSAENLYMCAFMWQYKNILFNKGQYLTNMEVFFLVVMLVRIKQLMKYIGTCQDRQTQLFTFDSVYI